MFRFWSFFIKNRRFSQLIIFTLIVVGLLSLIAIPKESNPEVEVPIGVVTTILPGGSAADVEKLVTNEIESGLTNLDNVKNLTSTSGESISSVVVEFDAKADLDKSIQDLKDQVDKIKSNLPNEAEDPQVLQIDFSSEPVMIISVATDRAATEVIDFAEDLERELKLIKGVSDVIPQGLRKREVQVIVDQEQLEKFGISLGEVTNALRSANASLPTGSIRFSGIEYSVSFDGDIEEISEVENIAITDRNGIPIYIRDIAFVSAGVEKATSLSRVSIGGEPSAQSVSFSIIKQSGGDIVEITEGVRERLAEMQEEGGLLETSDFLISFDVGEFIKDDLKNLTFTALQTVLLVMIILFIAIGWKEALLAGLAIPFSFLISFIGLNASGNTVNFVSLFSLILAVGILVDSAIVVVEGMYTNIRNNGHKPLKEVALDTLKEYHSPLFSGTLTTIAVFFPLFFISGITGEFIASIPFTMIFVLAASIIVALGLLPLIAVDVLKVDIKEKTFDKRAFYSHKIEMWYREKLGKVLGNRRREKKILLGSVVAFFFVLTLPMIGILEVSFFPQEDLDFVFLEIELESGTILEETDLITRAVEEILYEEEDIESFLTTVGSGSAFAGDSLGGGASNTKVANITINLKKDRKGDSSDVSERIQESVSVIKDAEVRVLQTNNGPPSGAPVLITFFGDNLADLERVALQSQDILKKIDGTKAVNTSTKDNGIEFVLRIDRAKAAELGISPAQVASVLRTAVQGATATTIKTDTADVDVVVKLNLNPNYLDPQETTNTTIDTVRQIRVSTPRGSVLLGSILDVSLERSSSVIRHEDSKRIATASSEVQSGASASAIISEFKKRALTELDIDKGIEMKIGGETEDVDQSFKEMGYAFIAGLLLMLAILVLQFDSFRYALFILVIIPFSLIGIFIGLVLTRKALSFPSLMGIIALSGILVNNSIILIDKMNNIRKRNPEKPMREVVMEGSVSRLRPILLTTITTVIGIFPLTYAAELWSPLAWAIIFGLSFSVVLTLVLVPILYDRWAKR